MSVLSKKHRAPKEKDESFPRRGVDVSEHNSGVNWDDVASDPRIGFVFVKVSEGMTYKDKRYTEGRVQAIREAGIPFGVYHFARPQTGRTGAQECDQFLDQALKMGWGKKGDIRGVLDIEAGTGREISNEFVRSFVARYIERMNHRPIIYTGSFWRDFMGNPIMMSRCPLWLAAYTPSWKPWVPKAWANGRPFFWQWTQTGNQKGIVGFVDVNRFLRKPSDFQKIRLRENKRG